MRLRTFLTSLFLGSALLIGCEPNGTDGELGNLNFEDRLDDLDDTSIFGGGRHQFDRPVAIGARVKVQVTVDQRSQEVSTATAEDTAVAQVTEVNEAAFVVEGTGEGTTVIEVVTKSDLTDRLSVNVRPLDRADLYVSAPELLIGEIWHAHEDVVLVAGGEITVAGKMLSADDVELTGYGALSFASNDETVATVAAEAESNKAIITAGSVPGQTTVKMGEYDALTIDVVDASAVTDVAITFTELANEAPIAATDAPLEFVAGRTYLVDFEAKTDDGRAVAAGLTSLPVMESDIPGLVHTLEQPESADDAAAAEGAEATEGEEAAEGEESPQVHWKGAGKQSAIFTFDTPGEGSITARWMGQEMAYAIKVVPAPPQQ